MELCKIASPALALILSIMSLFVPFALAAAAAAVAPGDGQQQALTAFTTNSAVDRAPTTIPRGEGYGGRLWHSSSSSSPPSSSPSLRRLAAGAALISGAYGSEGSAGGYSYNISRRPPSPKTCDKNSKVCRAPGSLGPDCCGKRCVNTETDGHNCGGCGRRCWFGSVCCRGRCVGLMYDRDNCGRCGNRCRKGRFCNYGMCNYAY